MNAPLQLARDMKSGAAEAYDYGNDEDRRGLPEGDETEIGPDGGGPSAPSGGSAKIIGLDQRELRRDNALWPMSTQIVMTTARCSATLIGESTATSVAHCFMDSCEAGILTGCIGPGQWRPLTWWGAGADAQDATVFPFGSRQGCYVPVFRKGWKMTGKFTYDYALMEFSDFYPTDCPNFPGNATGWLGWWQWSPSVIEDGRPGYVYGYPSQQIPFPGLYPQIHGRGCVGGGCFDVDGTDEIEYTAIDTTGGQSGAAFYQKNSAGTMRLVVGSHQGSADPFAAGVRNRARRVDGSFADLIKNYTAK